MTRLPALLTALALGALSTRAGAWPRANECDNQPSALELRDALIDYALAGAPSSAVSILRACRTKIDPSLLSAYDQCFARVDAYARLLALPGAGLPNMDNDTYASTYGANVLAMPARLADPDLFAKLRAANLSDLTSVRAVVDRIKALYPKAIVVPYVSATTPSIDNTTGLYKDDRRGRFVAWIPDDVDPTLSRYVQFSVNSNPATPPTLERVQASIVSFKTGTGAYVFDWQRDTTRTTFVYAQTFGNDQHCYTCHASGVLAIHPFQSGDDDVGDAAQGLGPDYARWLDPMNALYRDDVRALDERILTEYGTSKAGVVHAPTRRDVVPGAEFPNGLLEPKATDAYCTPDEYQAVLALRPRGPIQIDGWAQDWGKWLRDKVGWTPEILYKETPGPILDKKCSTCHKDRGSAVFDTRSYQDLTSKYIHGGWMPPNLPAYEADGEIKRNTVPLADRKKAARCFQKRLEAVVTEWLSASDCSAL